MALDCWKKKREVMRHYDELGDIYDLLYGDEQNRKIESALHATSVKGSDTVIDVGCGTGFLLDRIQKSVAMLIGVDDSIGLLKIAMKRMKVRPERKSAILVRADADHLPFVDKIFDKVFALTLLQNMPDSARALREMMRVAKHDSVIVVTGLRKSFTKDTLGGVLSKVGLEFSIAEAEDRTQDIIAVCRARKVKDK